ncbi:hypothetical protein pdam_00021439 [Pocillopora damicornis]|uniref:Uncharacterized protein n=1 Tax=Pocillopora damicornis TaxID=46731 RepID=A0A3M6V2W4_POCDA|nr:hypothetical protein pdam_00021439 [Pocillopora damicornis]
MTAAMNPKPEKLRRDAILKFRNLQVVKEEQHCMFWSGFKNSPDGFSREGCHVDHSRSNSEETIRERFKRKVTRVFPSTNNGNSAKRSSQVDRRLLLELKTVGMSRHCSQAVKTEVSSNSLKLYYDTHFSEF